MRKAINVLEPLDYGALILRVLHGARNVLGVKREVAPVVESSKFWQVYLHRICRLNELTTLITDSGGNEFLTTAETEPGFDLYLA